MTTRNILSLFAVLFVLMSTAPSANADQELLASAKSLYESASYEAALSELSAINSTELVDTVDTYRALCLLGLGRVKDAEQALELLVTRKPLLVLSDTEYSPRVVALFRDVRKKALPAAAQQLYTTAKTNYENKQYEAAAVGFKQTLQVIADVSADAQTAKLADLKELAGGFLELAASRAAPAPSAPATPAVSSVAAGAGVETATPGTITPAVAAPGSAPPAAAVSPAISVKPTQHFYTLADTTVTPPVPVEQQIPRWTFSTNLPQSAFTGILELLIDERGQVESVRLSDPVWPQYDAVLVQAAARWRYSPAVKDGKPVKFKRFLQINVDPRMQKAQ